MHTRIPALRMLMTVGLLSVAAAAAAADEPASDPCIPKPGGPRFEVPDHCPCIVGPIVDVSGAAQHAEEIQAKVRAVLTSLTGDRAPVTRHSELQFQVQDATVPVRTVTMQPYGFGAHFMAHVRCGDKIMTLDAEAVAFVQRAVTDLRAQREVALRVKVIDLDADAPDEPAR